MGEARKVWRVVARPAAPLSAVELLPHLMACHAVVRALTGAQRAVLLGAVGGRVSGHPRPVAALRAHGLVEEGEDVLSEAGVEVRFWNLPADHPERLAKQINEKRGGPTE